MKRIEKRAEPRALSAWKRGNEGLQPAYNDLPGEVKAAIKDALMEEQGFICCYCEQNLDNEGAHIEHLVPRHQGVAGADIDFNNMLCSCQNQTQRGEPRHCGHAKGGWYEPELMVSPLAADCEARFAYLDDGTIMPQDESDQGAQTTIEKLNLNTRQLAVMRSTAIEPFDGLSPEETRKFVAAYLSKDSAGRFNPFWTTIRYLFGDHADGRP